MKAIENVQRRETKIIPEIRDLTYANRLRHLNLPSIQYRQLRGDLIQTYKIVHDIDNVTKLDFFQANPSTKTRKSYLKLEKEYARSTVRCNFLSNRVKNYWNDLSFEAKSAKDVNTFKNYIDKELSSLRGCHV